jgi:prepilin-type processing-associated H-X9-DG protein
LRQIGLAAQIYSEQNRGRLPAVWRTDRAKEWDNFPWRAALLPHLEQQNLYGRINWSRAPLDEENLDIAQTVLLVFQCPSTPGYQRTVQSLGYADGIREEVYAGASDYAAVYAVTNSGFATYFEPGEGSSAFQAELPSDGASPGGSQLPGVWYGGPAGALEAGPADIADTRFRDVLAFQRHLRTLPASLSNVEDGLSNTAMIVEQSGRPDVFTDEGELTGSQEPPSDGSGMHPGDPQIDGLDPFGFLLTSQGAWATADSSAFAGTEINQDNRLDPFSFHRGVNVLMADGSVHRWSQRLQAGVLSALLSRDGGEIVDRHDW